MKKNSEKSLNTLEEKVVSDLLNDSEVLEDIVNKLDQQDFLNKDLGIIFSVAQILNKESKIVDPQTVINYIDNHAELQFEGYNERIFSLFNKFTTSVDVQDHVDIIKNASIKRKMDAFAAKIVNTKFDPTSFNDEMFKMEQEFMTPQNSSAAL